MLSEIGGFANLIMVIAKCINYSNSYIRTNNLYVIKVLWI